MKIMTATLRHEIRGVFIFFPSSVRLANSRPGYPESAAAQTLQASISLLRKTWVSGYNPLASVV
jgi:hypothetical protein